MHICCAYTIPVFELSTISEMPMNKASRFSGCVYSGRLLYNTRLTAKRFGRSSEKTSKDQLQLFEDVFNEAESNAEPFAPEPELITVPAHQRAKHKKKKGVSLEGLPETVVEYRLPEEELTCSCGHERHIIGQEVTKELVVVPAQFSVTKHVQYVYACRHCENHG